eukprot:947765-Pyramimonas_sp.AAC.1
MLRLGCYFCVGRAGRSELDGLLSRGCLNPSPDRLPLHMDGGGRDALEHPQWPRRDGTDHLCH